MNEPTKLEKRIAKLEKITSKKISRLEATVASIKQRNVIINTKYKNIISNRKHYLRYRATKVDKTRAKMIHNYIKLFKRFEALPKLNVHATSHAQSAKSVDRTLLLVSRNQARKIRALADTDLRSILNLANNRRSKTRVSVKYSDKKRK